MRTCIRGESCSIPNCYSFKSIINHWKICPNNNCLICSSLRQITRNNRINFLEESQSEVQSRVHQWVHSQGQQNISNVSLPASSTITSQAIDINQSSSVIGPLATTNLQQQSLNILEERRQICDTQTQDQLIVDDPQLSNATNPFISNQPTVAVGSNQATLVAGSNYTAAAAITAIPQQQLDIMNQLLRNNDFDQSTTSNRNSLQESKLAAAIKKISAEAVQGTKEWHRFLPPGLRNHLVCKLFLEIFSNRHPEPFLDRLNNLISYAQRLEVDAYKMASSKSDYYYLLAEKIYKIQREIHEKPQNRTEMRLDQQRQYSQSQVAASSGFQTFPTLQNFSQAAGPSSSAVYTLGINQSHYTQGSMPQAYRF
ncbi:histone lysine acetyltransferase CREBBP-like [Microplitis mediator]|uniref:histone lysine acetyltransferase CREBBP-like n=1 Tax=Microplitis mediator TaxID=375433 RepID=UPI0025541EB5|nr:histone lysine acetyltransferase CREBBP-like [Microplitis mediator]